MSDRTYTVTAWPYLEAWPMRHTGNEKWPFKLDDKLVIIHADDLERLRSRNAKLEKVVEAARRRYQAIEDKDVGEMCRADLDENQALRDLDAPCEMCGGKQPLEPLDESTWPGKPCPDCGGDDE